MKKAIFLAMAALAATTAAVVTGCKSTASAKTVSKISRTNKGYDTDIQTETNALADNTATADKPDGASVDSKVNSAASAASNVDVSVGNAEGAPSEKVSASFTNYRSNSSAYRALYDVITRSGENGAKGYGICRLNGSNFYHLIVSFGDSDINRYYEVYRIESNDVVYIGQLSGACTTVYIDADSARLCLICNQTGEYVCGSVWDDGELRVEYRGSHIVGRDNSCPTISGGTIDFNRMDDYSLIYNF